MDRQLTPGLAWLVYGRMMKDASYSYRKRFTNNNIKIERQAVASVCTSWYLGVFDLKLYALMVVCSVGERYRRGSVQSSFQKGFTASAIHYRSHYYFVLSNLHSQWRASSKKSEIATGTNMQQWFCWVVQLSSSVTCSLGQAMSSSTPSSIARLVSNRLSLRRWMPALSWIIASSVRS